MSYLYFYLNSSKTKGTISNIVDCRKVLQDVRKGRNENPVERMQLIGKF